MIDKQAVKPGYMVFTITDCKPSSFATEWGWDLIKPVKETVSRTGTWENLRTSYRPGHV